MKQIVSLTCAVIFLFFAASCTPRTGEMAGQNGEFYETEEGVLIVPSIDRRIELLQVNRRDVPEPVARWIDTSLLLSVTGFADTKEHGDTTYILVARGQRPTGGYDVRILDATRRSDEGIDVRVSFTRPPPDAMVTQVITYPHAIAAIRLTDISVNILPEGNDRPSRVTRLRGIDSLGDIRVSSNSIKVFNPAPNTETARVFSLSGVALIPDGNVYYKIVDSENRVRKMGGTLTASPLDWGYYETEIEIPGDIPDGSPFQLMVFRIDEAQDRETDQVTIPLTVQNT